MLPTKFHLAEGFQRRRLKCEKLTDNRCQVMAKAHSIALAKWAKKDVNFDYGKFKITIIFILNLFKDENKI
jgi:hypothetical protein